MLEKFKRARRSNQDCVDPVAAQLTKRPKYSVKGGSGSIQR